MLTWDQRFRWVYEGTWYRRSCIDFADTNGKKKKFNDKKANGEEKKNHWNHNDYADTDGKFWRFLTDFKWSIKKNQGQTNNNNFNSWHCLIKPIENAQKFFSMTTNGYLPDHDPDDNELIFTRSWSGWQRMDIYQIMIRMTTNRYLSNHDPDDDEWIFTISWSRWRRMDIYQIMIQMMMNGYFSDHDPDDEEWIFIRLWSRWRRIDIYQIMIQMTTNIYFSDHDPDDDEYIFIRSWSRWRRINIYQIMIQMTTNRYFIRSWSRWRRMNIYQIMIQMTTNRYLPDHDPDDDKSIFPTTRICRSNYDNLADSATTFTTSAACMSACLKGYFHHIRSMHIRLLKGLLSPHPKHACPPA